MARNRNTREEDYFVCQNCHAEVSIKARSCPECGADDETGWKEGAMHSGIGLREDDDFDYEDFIKRDMGNKGPKKQEKALWIVVAAVLLLIVLAARWMRIF